MSWTRETEELLRKAGWFAGRRERERVEGWRLRLERPGGFHWSNAARDALEEFGGLRVEVDGAGIDCAKLGFDLDPTLALGEEDRFQGFQSGPDAPRLFPLGEVQGGHAFVGIDADGCVYLVGDTIERVGQPIASALDALLSGRVSR